ncbi:L-lactate dehydrogenase [Sphingomonas japonica]|uniref:L-lactate dehydrogenase n=1 Tax=Sphingomonas japonica TaxID=511662 RepID=A0ABX0TZN0_9SPHN|nr:L-lactate dehydrogenase [Sphingomonas japonica]NIJ23774.1 L-lactate dehydrogenase [Sphingomonas japonica]
MTVGTDPPHASKIAVVGVGHVGATAAYALMLRALCHEIVLIDSDSALASAEAADLSDANALARPTRIRAGSFADAADAAIVVLTAGAASHGDQSRLSLATESAPIVTQCVRDLAAHGFGGILVVAANPVDLMTLLAIRHSKLERKRVVGTGTLLDTARIKQALGAQVAIAPSAIEAYVIGEHGDSEVPVFSTVRIGGQPIGRRVNRSQRNALAVGVRDAGYRIVEGKGFTSFGIATAIVRICEAILRDERSVLPVSSWVGKTYGPIDLCLSLPCVIGADGIKEILFPMLDDEEQVALVASAAQLADALAVLDRVV